MIGINSTKTTVALVRADFRQDEGFKILDSRPIDFSAESGATLIQLRDCLRPLLQQWLASTPGDRLAIMKCSEGRMAASAAAFKAEGVVQIVAAELNIPVVFVTPQSLAKGLDCAKGEKWQDRSKILMNANGAIKHWSTKGIQGAAAAAYKSIKK